MSLTEKLTMVPEITYRVDYEGDEYEVNAQLYPGEDVALRGGIFVYQIKRKLKGGLLSTVNNPRFKEKLELVIDVNFEFTRPFEELHILTNLSLLRRDTDQEKNYWSGHHISKETAELLFRQAYDYFQKFNAYLRS
ncbi:MAG: hypothetical protein V1725_07010 [archaeon]